MISFEREIRDYLNKRGVEYDDNSASYTEPDFCIKGRNGVTAFIEVKEKRQTYDVLVWPIPMEEHYAFIVDELTARKLLLHPLESCLFVRDNTTGLYYFADVMALWMMTRVRCVRNHGGVMKGKWIVNLRNFMMSDHLSDMFVFLRDYLDAAPGLVHRDVFPHRPDFVDEYIPEAGTPRTAEQKEYDHAQTR